MAANRPPIDLDYFSERMGVPNIVCEGDSITAGTYIPGTSQNAAPYTVWAQRLAAGTWLNKGVPSSKLADINGRLATTVYPFSPRLCVLLAGTNDMGVDANGARTTTATISTNLTANGIRPVWCTLLPRADDAAKQTLILAHNIWLKAFCAQYGYQCIDTAAAFSNADGSPITSLFVADGYHPTPVGYKLLGDTIGSAVALWRVPACQMFSRKANMHTDPNLTVDSNANGLADIFGSSVFAGSGAPTRTPSLVAHPVAGNYQRVTYAGTNLTDNAYYAAVNNLPQAGASGDVYDLALDVRMSNVVGVVHATIKLDLFDAASGAAGSVSVGGIGTASGAFSLDFSERLRTSITSTAAPAKYRIVVSITGSGSCTFDIGRIHLFKRLAGV